MAGHVLLAVVLCAPGPMGLVLGCVAWSQGADWAWIPLVAGLACSLPVPFIARTTARRLFPRITRRDTAKEADAVPYGYGDDTFVLRAPGSPKARPGARLARADVLEAALVRYEPEGEATFTSYPGTYTPNEFTPLVRLRLRVRGDTEVPGGAPDFEVTEEWRVPSVCLSAVTAGRLAVLVDPPGHQAPGKVTPLWPRSALLAGTRTSRVIDLEGRLTDVTRFTGRQLRQMRISEDVGGVVMAGDTIDLRRLDADTAARYSAVAAWARTSPEERAPVTEPGEQSRWIVDSLPGAPAAFGSVGRRWSRRGGVLVRGRFLRMSPTHDFQDHGPVLDTLVRIQPADGTPPFDAARRLTVPMNYLAVLHRTRDVVLYAAPNGGSYVVDWPRTCLLAGTAEATVVAPEGREISLAGRTDAIWALMNLLASHGLTNPTRVLDLRQSRMRAVAGPAMDAIDARP
ncbi:hypothetical protein ACF09C_06910 [Streptomyces sp. NPDC014870]|uniref:hypothetical protein n=1 Tax=Streptomyces sp. NPDC014870 TaxID=3364925 RepID=UPI0036F6C8D4